MAAIAGLIPMGRLEALQQDRVESAIIDWGDREGCDIAVQRLLNVYREKLPSLNLSQLSLTSIPQEIGEFVWLKELDLSENYLPILPDKMEKLHHLERLYLSYNKFELFPHVIASLHSLVQLDFSHNILTELLPEIGNLAHLEILLFCMNCIAVLPAKIGNLHYLKSLDLSYNQLREVPPEIGLLRDIVDLDLSYNKLTTLPDLGSNLSALNFLKLGANYLRECPTSIGNLDLLITLDLSGNPIEHFSPKIIQPLHHLQTLNIQGVSLEALERVDPVPFPLLFACFRYYLNHIICSKVLKKVEIKLKTLPQDDLQRLYNMILDFSKIKEYIDPTSDTAFTKMHYLIRGLATHQVFLDQTLSLLKHKEMQNEIDIGNLFFDLEDNYALHCTLPNVPFEHAARILLNNSRKLLLETLLRKTFRGKNIPLNYMFIAKIQLRGLLSLNMIRDDLHSQPLPDNYLFHKKIALIGQAILEETMRREDQIAILSTSSFWRNKIKRAYTLGRNPIKQAQIDRLTLREIDLLYPIEEKKSALEEKYND